MKKLLALIVLLILPSCNAQAQCSGLFPANTLCGSVAGGPPGPVAISTIIPPIATTASFYAEKNSVDQTGLTNAAYNLITFPNTFVNVGSYFDTSNNWWTPPAGYVSVHAAIFQTAHAASTGNPTFSLKVRRLHTGVTISNGSPAVITWPLHGLTVDQPIQFENSGGGLPSPLVVDTVYYVISSGFGANTFEIAGSIGGAAINTTTNGSGTQTGLCDVAAGIGTGVVGFAGIAIAQVDSKGVYSNGTDHYHVIFFTTSDTAGNDGVINGNPAHTHFSGHWVGAQ